MKKILSIAILLISLIGIAQTNENLNGLTLEAYIPEQSERIPNYAKDMLHNKLNQIITSNGISENTINPRFVITPNITVLSKDVLPTAPPKIALNLELSLYIGDGITGTLFSNQSITIKGVGTNETKAYISAIKNIKPTHPVIQEFVLSGKEKILNYFNSNCNTIIQQANSLQSQQKYFDALSVLASIPEASSCFSKIQSKIEPLYKRAIDQDCKDKLNQASSLWSTSQNLDSANKAGELLASIEPGSSCFDKVEQLYSKIQKQLQIQALIDREWTYKLKVLDLHRTRIRAVRDVAISYRRTHRHYITYKVRRWYYY